ncbi:MAG: hypothetical protein HY335_07760, partial [Deinococcus sp.]|nr:hypothetical protein [Deinococcus sp.]
MESILYVLAGLMVGLVAGWLPSRNRAAALAKQLQEETSKISLLEAKSARSKGLADNLKEALHQREEEVNALKQEGDEAKGTVTALKAQLTDLDAALKDLRTQLAAAEERASASQ